MVYLSNTRAKKRERERRRMGSCRQRFYLKSIPRSQEFGKIPGFEVSRTFLYKCASPFWFFLLRCPSELLIFRPARWALKDRGQLFLASFLIILTKLCVRTFSAPQAQILAALVCTASALLLSTSLFNFARPESPGLPIKTYFLTTPINGICSPPRPPPRSEAPNVKDSKGSRELKHLSQQFLVACGGGGIKYGKPDNVLLVSSKGDGSSSQRLHEFVLMDYSRGGFQNQRQRLESLEWHAKVAGANLGLWAPVCSGAFMAAVVNGADLLVAYNPMSFETTPAQTTLNSSAIQPLSAPVRCIRFLPQTPHTAHIAHGGDTGQLAVLTDQNEIYVYKVFSGNIQFSQGQGAQANAEHRSDELVSDSPPELVLLAHTPMPRDNQNLTEAEAHGIAGKAREQIIDFLWLDESTLVFLTSCTALKLLTLFPPSPYGHDANSTQGPAMWSPFYKLDDNLDPKTEIFPRTLLQAPGSPHQLLIGCNLRRRVNGGRRGPRANLKVSVGLIRVAYRQIRPNQSQSSQPNQSNYGYNGYAGTTSYGEAGYEVSQKGYEVVTGAQTRPVVVSGLSGGLCASAVSSCRPEIALCSLSEIVTLDSVSLRRKRATHRSERIGSLLTPTGCIYIGADDDLLAVASIDYTLSFVDLSGPPTSEPFPAFLWRKAVSLHLQRIARFLVLTAALYCLSRVLLSYLPVLYSGRASPYSPYSRYIPVDILPLTSHALPTPSASRFHGRPGLTRARSPLSALAKSPGFPYDGRGGEL